MERSRRARSTKQAFSFNLLTSNSQFIITKHPLAYFLHLFSQLPVAPLLQYYSLHLRQKAGILVFLRIKKALDLLAAIPDLASVFNCFFSREFPPLKNNRTI